MKGKNWLKKQKRKKETNWLKTTGIAIGGLASAAAGAAAYLRTDNGKKTAKKIRKKGWGSLFQS
ncbi:hypothetical protein [Salinithrix halophila]|uniref:YtxH-like protein n=1 Tax=Salinithrix halophila TaxID=1485204 RepID=A0ABV8JGF1_9BACL